MEKRPLDPSIFPEVDLPAAATHLAAEPEPPQESMPEETPKEGPEETDDINARIDALDEQRWKLYNILAGALLGLAGGLALFVFSRIDEFNSISFLVALVLVLLVPRFLENRIRRSVRTGKLAMVIAFSAMLVVQLIRGLAGRA